MTAILSRGNQLRFDRYTELADGSLIGKGFGRNTGLVYSALQPSGVTAATVTSGAVYGASREWAGLVASVGNDVDITLNFTAGNAENGQGTDYTDIRARVGGTNNGDYIMAQATQTGASLYRVVGGSVAATIGAISSPVAAALTVHTLRIRAVGTNVQGWFDGTSIGTGTDSLTGTGIGFHNYALSGRVSRFGITP